MKRDLLIRKSLSIAVAVVMSGSLIAAEAQTVAAAPKKHTYRGPNTDESWGTVQVRIVVQGKKIVKVKAGATGETTRSNFINANSIPTLKAETLKAQSASISTVSGATDTSDAFISSLAVAIEKAIKAKTLA